MVGRRVQSVDNLRAKSNIASSMNSNTLSTAAGCDAALPRRPASGKLLIRHQHVSETWPWRSPTKCFPISAKPDGGAGKASE
jgi:hypothetical protein